MNQKSVENKQENTRKWIDRGKYGNSQFIIWNIECFVAAGEIMMKMHVGVQTDGNLIVLFWDSLFLGHFLIEMTHQSTLNFFN